MSSPFSSFRKHQKKMLAFLGVLCMLVFVVGSSAMSCVEGPGTSTNAVVVTTKYDTYRETDVRTLVIHQQVFNKFISSARQAAGLQGIPLAPPSEENAVQTKIMADLAGTMGITVSDESINRFMRRVVGNKLDGPQLKSVLRQYDISEVVLFNAIRNQMLAGQLQQLMFPDRADNTFQRGPPPNVTPAERWQYYLRINRQSHVEILRVPVASFVDQVKDPDEDTLRAFFEEHKELLPDPDSPVPGFRRPPLAAFQTIFADYNTFYEEEKPKVTQEQIEKYYEENKDPLYRYTGLDEPEDDSPVRAPDPEPQTPDSTDGQPDSGNPPAPANPDPPDAGLDAPGTDDDPCQTEDADGNATPPADGDDDRPSPDNPPTDNPPTDPADDPPTDPADNPPPAGGGPDDATPPETHTPLATLKSDLLTVPRDITAGRDPEFDPLWKVEDSIRETLARQAAEKRIDEALAEIRRSMDDYYRQWTQWEAIGDGAEPQKPDLEQMVADAGMQLRPATKLLSPREALDTDLGETNVDLGGGSTVPFVQAAFLTLSKYQPGLGTDADDNRYLFWIIDEREGFIPAWDAEEQEKGKPPLVDRDEVVRAWKMIEARQPAHKRAEELAAEARKSKQPLTEMSFAGKPGEALPPFSWMTMGFPPQMSQVEGVENPGEEFMQTVFDLEPGQLGVAFDHPQTTAYVIRLTDVTVQLGFGGSAPLDSQVHSRFYTSPFFFYQGAADEDYDELFQQWIRRVNEEVGLDWKRTPDPQQ